MIVCVCRRVSDHQIRQAAADGVTTLDELQMELGVATQCGRCAECACDVLAQANGAGQGASAAAGTVVAWAPSRRAERVGQPA